MLQKLEDKMHGTCMVEYTGEDDEEILSFIHQQTSVEMVEWSKRIVNNKPQYTGLVCDPNTGHFWVCFINLVFEPNFLMLYPVSVNITERTIQKVDNKEQEIFIFECKMIKQYWIIRHRPSEIASIAVHIEKALSKREEDSKYHLGVRPPNHLNPSNKNV